MIQLRCLQDLILSVMWVRPKQNWMMLKFHSPQNYNWHFPCSNLRNLKNLNLNSSWNYQVHFDLKISNFVVNCYDDVQSPSHGNVLTFFQIFFFFNTLTTLTFTEYKLNWVRFSELRVTASATGVAAHYATAAVAAGEDDFLHTWSNKDVEGEGGKSSCML